MPRDPDNKLAKWKKEYYPSPASRSSKHRAAEHSLRKWLGMRKGVLKKHGLTKFDLNDAHLDGSGSCALCHHFYTGSFSDPCATCPLAIVRGGVACDSAREDEERAPYYMYVKYGDAGPMIKWLRRAVKHQALTEEEENE